MQTYSYSAACNTAQHIDTNNMTPPTSAFLAHITTTHLGASKICDRDMTLRVDKKILGLEITMHYSAPVQLFKCQCDLCCVDLRCTLVKRRMVVQHVQKLPTREIIHHNIQAGAALKRKVHVDDVRMTDVSQNIALRLGASQVVLNYAVFSHAFHGINATCLFLPDLIDLAESALHA